MALEIKGRRPCPDVLFKREILGPTTARLSCHWGGVMRGVPRVTHHSPAGIEWGYNGSGPADAALSILAYCLPLGCDGFPHVNLWKGQVSETAWVLHQVFKRERIARLPEEGGTLSGREVDVWIDEQLAIMDGAHQEGAANGAG